MQKQSFCPVMQMTQHSSCPVLKMTQHELQKFLSRLFLLFQIELERRLVEISGILLYHKAIQITSSWHFKRHLGPALVICDYCPPIQDPHKAYLLFQVWQWPCPTIYLFWTKSKRLRHNAIIFLLYKLISLVIHIPMLGTHQPCILNAFHGCVAQTRAPQL